MISKRGVKESALILNVDVVQNAESGGILSTYKITNEKDNKIWVYKTNTSHEEDEIESAAGEFYRVILPESPMLRTAYDETGYPTGVLSELDKNFFTANSYKNGLHQLPSSPEAVRKMKNGIAALACGLVVFEDNDEYQHENWAVHADGTIVKIDHALTFITMREGKFSDETIDTLYIECAIFIKNFVALLD